MLEIQRLVPATLLGEALADNSGRAIFPEMGTGHPHRGHEGKSDVKTKD